jgi:Tfp pilus assembly protein PilF
MKTGNALLLSVGMAMLSACKPAPPVPEPASKPAAMACLQKGDLPCAEANLTGYMKQYPDDSDTAAVLAIVLSQSGKHREALPFFVKAVAAGQNTYDVYANYARSLDAMGDLDGAIANNRKALEIVPSLVDVRSDLAGELVRSGKPEEAVALLMEFDDQLVEQGHPRYFPVQIAEIEAGMKKHENQKPKDGPQ